MTPAGTPASCRISATRNTDREASEAGLSTVVHPLARTAPMIQNWPPSGPFQGMMPPMTPTGAFNVIVATLPGMPFISVSPEMLVACPAKNASIFIRAGLELRSRRDRGAHVQASIWISSSNLSSRTWAMRVSNPWRSYGVQVLHSPLNALRAARTARSTSASPPEANRARTSPVDGFVVVSVFPDTAGTLCPSIKRWCTSRDKKPCACSLKAKFCSVTVMTFLSDDLMTFRQTKN